MKNLRKIFDALSTLRRVPSAAIANAWEAVKEAADEDAHSNSQTRIDESIINLIDGIIGAVVSMAKDDEDKAAAPGKADKPAT